MSKQLFEEIRSVEIDAEKILSDSEKQSAEIISNANKQSIKLLSEKETELKELRANTINAAATQAAKERGESIEQSKKCIEELRKIANKRKEKALSLVIEKLSESIGE